VLNRLAIRSGLSLLLLFNSARPAPACFCAPRDVDTEVELSAVVFRGTFVGYTPHSAPRVVGWRFRVDAAYKGAVAGDTLVIAQRTGDSCNVYFGEEGEDFLVYAVHRSWSDGSVPSLTTSICQRTAAVDEVAADEWLALRRVGLANASRWSQLLPDTLTVGDDVHLRAEVEIPLFEPGARVESVIADLTGLGGTSAVALERATQQTFRLDAPLTVAPPNGLRSVALHVTQVSGTESFSFPLPHTVTVLPGHDLMILGDELAPGWTWEAAFGELTRGSGASGSAWSAVGLGFSGWALDLAPAAPVSLLGYRSLRFDFEMLRGDVPSRPRFDLSVDGGPTVDLLAADLELVTGSRWSVDVPLARLGAGGDLGRIRWLATFEGDFHLTGIALTKEIQSRPTVVETRVRTEVGSADDILHAAPNPTNAGMTLHFTVPERLAGVAWRLRLVNTLGQQVAVLGRGLAEAGVHRVTWGRTRPALATGVYLVVLDLGEGRVCHPVLILR